MKITAGTAAKVQSTIDAAQRAIQGITAKEGLSRQHRASIQAINHASSEIGAKQ